MPSISGRAFSSRTIARSSSVVSRSGRRESLAVHAEFGRGLRFAADVNFGGGIISHQHDCETGRPAGMGDHLLNARPALGFYLVANAISIKDCGHQTNVTDEGL